MNSLKLESIALSVLIYLSIVVAILFSILYNPTPPQKRAEKFVESKGKAIEISLGSPAPVKPQTNNQNRLITPLVAPAPHITKKIEKTRPKKVKKKVKKKKKKVVKKRKIKKRVVKKRTKRVNKVRNIKKVTKKAKKTLKKKKKVVKKSIKKEPKSLKSQKIVKRIEKKSVEKPKKSVETKDKPKVKAKELFGSIGNIPKTKDVEAKKGKEKPKELKPKQTQEGAGGKANVKNKKLQDKGKENRYLGKVSRLLRGWPAQSNFSGEKIRVKLVIYSSGLFDYKILYKSLNPEFNSALKSYLEQLKNMGGFGAHSNSKPYRIEVEFIAK